MLDITSKIWRQSKSTTRGTNWNRKYWLKDGIYAVTIISVDISMHIQIFISMKASFFLKGTQQPGLIIEMMLKKERVVKERG